MEKKIEVEIISKETITPSSPTPSHHKAFKLSILDQILPIFYFPIVLYYPNNNVTKCATQNETQHFSTRLKSSFAKTLSCFFPFAGRFKDHLTIECNDEGALFVEARIHGCDNLSEFLKNPHVKTSDMFLPFPISLAMARDHEVLVAVQVNFFSCGGFAIGACFCHRIADASTMSSFLQCWACIMRDVEFYDHANDGQKKEGMLLRRNEFVWASQLFPPVDNLRSDSEFFLGNVTIPKEGKGVRRRFVFDSKAIRELQDKVKCDLVPNPSRVLVISCFIWKCAMVVSKIITPSGATPYIPSSAIVFAVNMRPRMEPPIPKDCIGNISLNTIASHKVLSRVEDGERLGDQLQDLVIGLRDAIDKMNNEFLCNLRGGDGFGQICKVREDINNKFSKENIQESYLFTSWCKLGFNEVDFGCGKPRWISYSGGDVVPFFINHCVLIESGCGDGIEAWLQLDEDEMENLECDPEFLEFASVC